MSDDSAAAITTAFENISDAVFHYAAKNPDAPALIDGRETLTYAELATLVSQAAVYLTTLGIKAGQRVGIALTNSADHVILSLATLRIGAVLIELPADIETEVLAQRVTRLAITATFVEVGGPRSTARIALRVSLRWRETITHLSGDARFGGDPGDLRLIILSSGSTGIPKGILTTQRQRMLRAAVHTTLFAEIWSKARPGNLLLISSTSAALFSQFLTNQILLGGPTVLLPKYAQITDLVRSIAAWDDVICPVTPGIGQSFLARTDHPGVLFPAMRALIVSGLPLALHDKRALLERVTPNLHELYGSGGFGTFSHLAPHDLTQHPGSVGRAISVPSIEIEIVGPDDQPVPPGTPGRLRGRGPNTSIGFFNPEDNTRGTERFTNGWYYPGDIAQADADGYIFLKGRQADEITLGGSTLYPAEIEDVITQCASVAEACVVGRPALAGGDELVAFIVGRPGYRHEDIAAFCRTQLPPSQRPQLIYYLKQIPRTGADKIDRPALKAQALREAKNEAALARQPARK
jgi:acyl-CoA synthetase (AMP-forming)/AMP-acid ligase II